MGSPVVSTGDLTAPPGADEHPPLPGQSGNPLMPNGLPALQPHGVDLQKLFSEDIRDPVERIRRVENAVVEMRRDFDAVLPSIVRLVAVEQDMQDLTRQLGVLLQNEPQASTAASPVGAVDAEPVPRLPPAVIAQATQSQPQTVPLSAAIPTPPATASPPSTAPPQAQAPPVQIPPAQAPPVPAPPEPLQPVPRSTSGPPVTPEPQPPPPAAEPAAAPPETVTPAPAGKAVSGVSDGLSIRDVRLGEHGGTTRIVMDASGRAPYHYDLDNDEKLLVIELPGTAWKAAAKQAFASSPLVASYTAQQLDSGGTRLIIQLKAPTKVVYESTLGASGTAPVRIVLDLKK